MRKGFDPMRHNVLKLIHLYGDNENIIQYLNTPLLE